MPGRTQVEFARFLDGGRIACVSVDEGLTLLEPDGSVVWHLDVACHHEVAVVPDGRPVGKRSFALAVHAARTWRGRSVRFDDVLFVDEATGRADPARPAWSTFEHRASLMARADGPHPLDRPLAAEATDAIYDYFHLNSIAFDGPDTMLVCLRNVDLIVEVELASGELGRSFGPGELDWPHAPSLVGEGEERRVLLFDNGKHRGWSRVVEVDLGTGEIAWEFRGTPSRALFSEVRGFAQRLSNGNTLVTESERGCLLEVTPSGETVWEFLNPERRGSGPRRARRRIYRALAVDRDDALGTFPEAGR
ncbi:MAG: arylsulfotransferase family protein [Planctomycetota bacterium]